MTSRWIAAKSSPVAIFYILASLLIFLPGCIAAGFIAQALPKPPVKAAYTGLQNQTVAVMVWADRGIRIDFPRIALDTATGIQNRLTNPVDDKGKPKGMSRELKGARFPYIPASVVRYQVEHPEVEGMAITEVAPKLGVSRLIYLEIEQFQTRSDSAVELYRGTMIGTLRVVEVTDGVAKVAYEENDVRVDFPKKAREEGVPELGDSKTYVGTINIFAQEVVNRFVEHPAEED
jgi:hypothetical protein